MINQFILKIEGRQSSKDKSALIKGVWDELMEYRKGRRPVVFLKMIVSNNPRFTIEEDFIVWHGLNYNVIFSETIPQHSESLDTFYMPLTDEHMKVILRIELYFELLNEYDVCLQDEAKAIWNMVLEQTK